MTGSLDGASHGRERDGIFPVVLVIAAALFNTLLAFVNANVTPLGGGAVVACEVAIVAAAHVRILRHFEARMLPWYFLAIAFAAFALLRINVTGTVDAKFFRDIFLIITFVLFGMTSTERRAIHIMALMQVFVVAGILLEAICLPCYGDLLGVKEFYKNTRGIDELEFTNAKSDLYVSATRPDDRFLPFFDLHRLSSVFLEPVSLGNFMVLTVAFAAAFWRRFGSALKLLFVASALLTLFASDGRLATLASLCILALSFWQRLVPKHAALLFLPAGAIAAILLTHLAGFTAGTDDLAGRTAVTVDILTSMAPLEYLGLSDRYLAEAVDAGIAYLITTQSFFGLALLWGFLALSAREETFEKKIYKNAIMLYLALTMLVSNSFLSIKTAAPLWFVFGTLLSAAPYSQRSGDRGEQIKGRLPVAFRR